VGSRTSYRVLLIASAGLVLAATVAVVLATATAGGLQLTVSPKVSAADTPLIIRVSGAQPGAKVVLSVTSVDAAGIKWSSTSTYQASSAGSVDPATTAAMYFDGPDPMGPVDFMRAPEISPAKATIWPFGLSSAWRVSNTRAQPMYSWAKCSLSLQGQHGCTWSKPLRFIFTATSGHARASVTVQRGPALPVTARFESVAATGFYGVFWQPPASHDNHIGVVEFAGSEGGINNPVGAMLAMHGYPTLDLAYFGMPGLPQAAKDLNLDYFAKALHWLGRQPGVDPRRLWVMGWSLGSMAALLVGAHYPNLTHGVVALEPFFAAICNQGQGSPVFTFEGRPVPCTKHFAPAPTNDPAVLIPVAKLDGAVLLVCGDEDPHMGDCAYDKTVMAQLTAAHSGYPHELLEYPEAAHGLGMLLPYYPGIVPMETSWGINGYTPQANPLARADAWPKLLSFLRS
jgi:dienelactone hydrolase